MARMIPSPMRADVDSQAERFLYDLFARDLSDEWTCIHQAEWVGKRRGRRGMDGEADFVLLHPTHGILVLEAKSGVVEPRGDRGEWVQRVGGREDVLPQPPLAQAADSRRALQSFLLSKPRLRGRAIHVVNAVGLPFMSVPAAGLGPSVPRDRVLDASSCGAVGGWVRNALRSVGRAREDLPALGAFGVEQAVDAIAAKRTLHLDTSAVASDVEARLAQLSDDQHRILGTLCHVPRAHVVGGPGTGKTLLAVEAARRFAAQELRTLLLCFNAPLGGHLHALTQGVDRLDAAHYHGFCRSAAERVGLGGRLAAAENRAGYASTFPEVLMDAMERSRRRYDAVVVDEAQDFDDLMWTSVLECLEDAQQDYLYVFEDPRQAIRPGAEETLPAGLVGPFPLDRNYRNTDEIHAFLQALPGGGDGVRPSGVTSGYRPRITWLEDPDRLDRATSRLVDRVIREYGIPARDITVLTPRSRQRSGLGHVTRLGPASAAWRERTDDHTVLIDTIHRFKGLESRAVIVTEMDANVRHDPEALLLVACSRPTLHLDVLLHTDAAPLLGDAVACADVP